MPITRRMGGEYEYGPRQTSSYVHVATPYSGSVAVARAPEPAGAREVSSLCLYMKPVDSAFETAKERPNQHSGQQLRSALARAHQPGCDQLAFEPGP